MQTLAYIGVSNGVYYDMMLPRVCSSKDCRQLEVSVDDLNVSENGEITEKDVFEVSSLPKVTSNPELPPSKLTDNAPTPYAQIMTDVLDLLPKEQQNIITKAAYGNAQVNLRQFIEELFKTVLFDKPMLDATAHIITNEYEANLKEVQTALQAFKLQPEKQQKKVINAIVQEAKFRVDNDPHALEKFAVIDDKLDVFKAGYRFLLNNYTEEYAAQMAESYKDAMPVETITGARGLDMSKLENIDNRKKYRSTAIRLLTKEANKTQKKIDYDHDINNMKISCLDTDKAIGVSKLLNGYKNQHAYLQRYLEENTEQLSPSDAIKIINKIIDNVSSVYKPVPKRFKKQTYRTIDEMLISYTKARLSSISESEIQALARKARDDNTTHQLITMYYLAG